MERTYRASTYTEALTAVKHELGSDAVILSTRQTSRFGKGVEVRAARASDATADGTNVAPSREGETEQILEHRLLRMGVPERAAKVIIGRLRVEHGRVPATIAKARPSIETILGDELVFAGGINGRPRVVALVGPTGVGKTTTCAKLAAQHALALGHRVSLVSTDTYRVGGAEQLYRYAELIGIPMETAADGQQLRRALHRLSSCELVLIDTAGRSPTDRDALAETAAHLAATEEPVEVHLCISAATSEIEQRSITERHAVLRPTRLLMTKLDEAVYHGPIIAAQTLAGLPFSYFTTGQRVPEDIELASAQRLAALLCGEEVHA